MNLDDYIEYTPEGMQKVIDSIDFLPKETATMMIKRAFLSIVTQ